MFKPLKPKITQLQKRLGEIVNLNTLFHSIHSTIPIAIGILTILINNESAAIKMYMTCIIVLELTTNAVLVYIRMPVN